jgi:hypothetical protein
MANCVPVVSPSEENVNLVVSWKLHQCDLSEMIEFFKGTPGTSPTLSKEVGREWEDSNCLEPTTIISSFKVTRTWTATVPLDRSRVPPPPTAYKTSSPS